MTIRLVDPPPNTTHREEFVLWTLVKDTRKVEARTRIAPIGVELVIYITRHDGSWDLHWSQIVRDGAAVHDLARASMREYEVRGWRVAEEL